jgi:hypothetical protein
MAIDQGESWVNLGGDGTVNPHTGFGTIGQIFFRTAEAMLDENDQYQIAMLTVGIKEYLAQVVGLHRMKAFTFGFIGWADYRGAASYNQRLSADRAEMVKQAFDPYFAEDRNWKHFYSSVSVGAGEGSVRDSASLHKDRRVDIACSRTFPQKKEIVFPDQPIGAVPKDPDLSKRFAVRTIGGISAEIPFTPIGTGVMIIEIKNLRNGKTIGLQHEGAGGGPGLPIGFNKPSDFQNFETPYYMKLDDFVGEGDVSGASVPLVGGATNLIFYGPLVVGRAPKNDILFNKPLVVMSEGWDLQLGVGGIKGTWVKLPPGYLH